MTRNETLLCQKSVEDHGFNCYTAYNPYYSETGFYLVINLGGDVPFCFNNTFFVTQFSDLSLFYQLYQGPVANFNAIV